MKPNNSISMVSYLLIVATVCITRNAAQPSKDGDDNTLKPVKFTPIKSADSKEMKEEKKETKAELVEPVPDISDSVRERIEADSKRVGRIAENLVGVQGDINRVEKEVLGKVFDMSSMKSFLDKHEIAIKDHEKFTQQEDYLGKQANALTKQVNKAMKETAEQEAKHREAMGSMSAKIAEDKSVIQGLEKELVPLIEMEKEVQKLPPVNANLTAQNTEATAAAKAATQELIYEKSKLSHYKDTTKNLMKELVKQHDYATKCHERLTQLNGKIHEVETKRQAMKYEQGRVTAKGAAMAKYLEEKNALISARLKKSKTNMMTINFAKGNTKGKIKKLQIESQLHLEKMKKELGELRQQTASIETALMAKVTNRKLIEKALAGSQIQIADLQARLVAGHLEKLRNNNTQMTSDLTQIRNGLQKSQIATAKAEAQQAQLVQMSAQYKKQAKAATIKAQEVAREALAKVVATKASEDEAQQKAQQAVMAAEAAMLTKCSQIWEKEHPKVNEKLETCKQVKMDLANAKANVASLTASVKAAQR